MTGLDLAVGEELSSSLEPCLIKKIVRYQHILYPLRKLIPVFHKTGSLFDSYCNCSKRFSYPPSKRRVRGTSLECRQHDGQIERSMKRRKVPQAADSGKLDISVRSIQEAKAGGLYPAPILSIIGDMYTHRSLKSRRNRKILIS